MKNQFIALAIMLLLGGCKSKEGLDRAWMVNNSNEEVVFLFSDSYPDTSNFEFISCSTKDISRIVPAFQSKALGVSGTTYLSWEQYLSLYPHNTAMVFAYNADSAGKIAEKIVGCDSLYKRPDLILKRFDVDISYLISHDWKLTYP